MMALLLMIYLVIVLLLIAVILVQQPRGGGLTAALGGGGVENILGVRGAPTFFTKLTAVLGGLYLVLSLVLSLMNSPHRVAGTAIERALQQQQQTLPLQPLRAPEQTQQGEGQ